MYEPIGFASKKFSATAMNWDTFKKEAYVAFFGINYFAYYLRGKAFILETDHRNLQWIEKSEVSMVVRWRVFMQSFCVFIRHIPGTKNFVEYWLSRMVVALFRMSVEEFHMACRFLVTFNYGLFKKCLWKSLCYMELSMQILAV